MIKSVRLILILVVLLSQNRLFAQSTPLDQTLSNLQKQAADYPFEKVYLYLDKPCYGAGDTIWFKGYVTVGQMHYLTGISYVLNADLINEQNAVIRSIKLPLVNGLTCGDFALPDTLQEGNYRIRAYTNWMRNTGYEYFFDKTIAIGNAITNKIFTQANYTYTTVNGHETVNVVITYTDIDGEPYANKEVAYQVELDPQKVAKGKGITGQSGSLHLSFTNPSPGILNAGHITTVIDIDKKNAINKTIAIKAGTSKIDMQFFPESGSLVNGVTSKIAFKAVGADGLGIAINGTITDGQNNQLAVFNSSHLGMGSFFITPQAGKSYQANFTGADGTKNTVQLPKALDKGYVLTIDNADSLNNVIVQITGASDESQSGSVTLVAQTGGHVYFEGKSKPGKTNFTAVISKSRFPSGLVQFTLFSELGEPLCERLIFIQNRDKLKVSVNTDEQSYAPRQKVKLTLNVKDNNNRPVQGNFSIAVTNEAIVPVNENMESTIFSNTLLASDIRGYIEQPNYYFAHVDAKTAADLDLLMLTQGYHRFEWKAMINNTPPTVNYQPEKALTISGIVRTRSGKPVINGKVTMVNLSQGVFLIDTVTDKNGRFSFMMAFADSNKFTVRALTARGGENVVLELDQLPAVKLKNKNSADVVINMDKGMEPYLRNSKKRYEEAIKFGIGDHSILLKEVTVSNNRKSARQIAEEKAVEFSSNLNGRGQADQIITADDIDVVGGATLWDRLAGRLAGVEFRMDSGTLLPYSVRSSNQMNGPAQPMAVIIDGLFGRDITLIPISQIESVEVLRSMNYLAAYGSRASNGILVVTTKHGGQEQSSKSNEDTPGLINYTPKGYYKARRFYSPQYDVLKPNAKVADLRSTISWNPLIQTDKDGSASIGYFNADSTGAYRVVVEGIDYLTGSIGRQVYTYIVK